MRNKIICHKGNWMTEQTRNALKRIFDLVALPPEIRHQIISHLLPPGDNIVRVFLPGYAGTPPTPIALPVTARLGDRQLRQETLMVTIERTTWSVHSYQGNIAFNTWLSKVDLSLASSNYATGYDAVKSLHFPYFSRYPHVTLRPHEPNLDIELMLKCNNLEKVTMEWVGQELNIGAGSPKSVQQLRTQYRLDRMLNLKKIKCLRLRLIRDHSAANLDLLRELGAWFKANMATIDGQAIDVVVCKNGERVVEEIYFEPLDGFHFAKHEVPKLNRSLYGLRNLFVVSARAILSP